VTNDLPARSDEGQAQMTRDPAEDARRTEEGSNRDWAHEYVSGVVGSPPTGAIWVWVVNRGDRDAFVRVLVYDGDRFVVQSNDSGQTSVGDLVRPGQVWSWGTTHGDDVRQHWVRVLTTSLDVVPSVQFVQHHTPPRWATTYVYQAPGDLALFDLPHRLPRHGPTEGPVIRDL
jgi:hypothetical protein